MCFNGAASARSRKCFKYPGGSLPCSMLQWGRERALAEMHLRDQAHRQRPEASMGPRARARGNEIETTVAVPYRMLQWGRERALAEMGWPGQGCALARGFNGAASARSRKSFTEDLYATVRFWLQWGRERALAEMNPRRTCLARRWSASMGPRARARGNS